MTSIIQEDQQLNIIVKIKLEKLDLSDLMTDILGLVIFNSGIRRYEILDILKRSSSTVHENLLKLEGMSVIFSDVLAKAKKGRRAYRFYPNVSVREFRDFKGETDEVNTDAKYSAPFPNIIKEV